MGMHARTPHRAKHGTQAYTPHNFEQPGKHQQHMRKLSPLSAQTNTLATKPSTNLHTFVCTCASMHQSNCNCICISIHPRTCAGLACVCVCTHLSAHKPTTAQPSHSTGLRAQLTSQEPCNGIGHSAWSVCMGMVSTTCLGGF
uniref:Uncharacterized protein n=1 Tax=Dunaliella tertiolecta TaxID=3047 RepID=A0A7S3QUY1_DUNTE